MEKKEQKKTKKGKHKREIKKKTTMKGNVSIYLIGSGPKECGHIIILLGRKFAKISYGHKIGKG